jgi:hypothetical protein
MKLTKGKLSKIYNKKKQTMRKFKLKAKRARRGKTFRKKRHLNLNRKTLKNVFRYGGGDGSVVQSPGPATVSAAETLRSVLKVEEPEVEEPEVIDASQEKKVGVSVNDYEQGKMDIL